MNFDINTLYTTTEYTLDKIGNYKNWWDALLLYFRYIKQARLQNNIQTFSNDCFMEKAMNWGRDRLDNAKKILKELWLVEVVQKRDEWGKMSGIYIKVNYIIDTEANETVVRENRRPVWTTDGRNTHKYPSTKLINTLVPKENTVFQEKLNYENKNFEEFWNLYPKKVNKKQAEQKYNLAIKKTKHETIIEWLNKYLLSREVQGWFIKSPDWWLHNEKWNDENIPYEASEKKEKNSAKKEEKKETYRMITDEDKREMCMPGYF